MRRMALLRSRVLPALLLLALVSAGLVLLMQSSSPSRAFIAGRATSTVASGPVTRWLHNEVILRSRKAYPLVLMIGFIGHGNVLLRVACIGKPYPTWLFGFLVGFICYTYPGAVCSDLLFVRETPRVFYNDNIFLVFTCWFVIIQRSERVYQFLIHPHVLIWHGTWWLADGTRASMLFLERAVTYRATFSQGIWQAFVWCSAGPLLRIAEASLRGRPVPDLKLVQPDSFNAFQYPLISMWVIMVLYLIYLGYFVGCDLFGEVPKKTMVECGDEHGNVYAMFVYVACILNLVRGYRELLRKPPLPLSQVDRRGGPRNDLRQAKQDAKQTQEIRANRRRP